MTKREAKEHKVQKALGLIKGDYRVRVFGNCKIAGKIHNHLSDVTIYNATDHRDAIAKWKEQYAMLVPPTGLLIKDLTFKVDKIKYKEIT